MKKSYYLGSILLLLLALTSAVGLHFRYLSYHYVPVLIGVDNSVIWSSSKYNIPKGSKLLAVENEDGDISNIKITFSWLKFLQNTNSNFLRLKFITSDGHKRFFVKSKIKQHPPIFPKFLYTIPAGLIMLFSIFIFFRKIKESNIYVFLILTVSTSYVMLLSYINLGIILTSPFYFTLFLFWNALAPPSLLIFFLRYPTVKRFGKLKYSFLFFIPSILAFFVTLFFYFKLNLNPTPEIQNRLFILSRSVLPFINLLYGIGSVISIFHTLLFADKKNRNRMITIIYGLFVILLILTSGTFVGSEHTAMVHIVGGGSNLLMVLYGIMIISLSASAFEYGFYPNENIVHKTIIYFILSIAVAVIYLFISWLLGMILSNIFDFKSVFVIVSTTVLITASLMSFRGIVQRNLDRLFFKNRFLYAETLQEIGDKLSSVMDINRLLLSILRILSEALDVNCILAFLAEKPGGNLKISSKWGNTGNYEKYRYYKYSEINKIQSLFKGKTVILREDLFDIPKEIREKYLKIYDELNSEVLVFLRFQGDLLGFLSLGRKKDDIYNGDDLDLLDSVGKQSALGIKNALSYSTIMKLYQSLSEQKKHIETLKSQLEVENIYLRNAVLNASRFGDIIGESKPMLELKDTIRKIASTDSNILILGESGTGKELVARTIHSFSNRKKKPLITVNCAAIPDNLLESELFGYVKGAFTGASKRKIGQFEMANNSTLFLDEIGELPLLLQPKILRAIQEGEITPLGSEKNIKVNVRIISATNANLQEKIKQGTFREDLYYRINVVPVYLPPLRERGNDIKLLSAYFLEYHTRRTGKKIKGFSKNAMERMKKYNWPGNVRELSNVVERAVAMTETGILDKDIFIPDNSDENNENNISVEHKNSNYNSEEYNLKQYVKEERFLPYKEAIFHFKREYIKEILRKVNGNKTEAAKLIGIRRTYLHRLLKELNLEEY